MGLQRTEGYPRAFGAYLLLSSLGRGGMGEVFLAKKRAISDIDRLCIVKTLRGDLAEHGEYVRRFMDEARVVVQLNHSNVCQVYESGRVGNDYFLAMEYIPGVNLKDLVGDLLARNDRLSPGLALWIGEQICEALGYAHRVKSPVTGEHLRVIHRDVSPANVMVSFEGEVKLIDFGLAESALKTEQTETRLVMGKVAYMAPEQARGEEIDGTTDQFAAAVVVYEMIAGDRFYGDFNTHQVWQVVGQGGFLPRRWNDVDSFIRGALARALDADRTKRFPTCQAFASALEDLRARKDPRAGRNALRELMQRLYGDRAEAERDLIASFADLRAPEMVANLSSLPPQLSGANAIAGGLPPELTEKSDKRRPAGWDPGTEPWRNSASDSNAVPSSSASLRPPGTAIPPDEAATAKALASRSGPSAAASIANQLEPPGPGQTRVIEAPPSTDSGSNASPSATPATIDRRPRGFGSAQSGGSSVAAALPANTQGRIVLAATAAVAIAIVVAFLWPGSEPTSVVAVVDAGGTVEQRQPAVVDAGSVAPAVAVVVDAGSAPAVAAVVDAGAADVVAVAEPETKDNKRKPRNGGNGGKDSKRTPPVVEDKKPPPVVAVVEDKKPPVVAVVEEKKPPVVAVVETKAPPPATDPVAEAPLSYRELMSVVERCQGKVACANKVMGLPYLRDPTKVSAALALLRPCASSCMKAGVPR